MSWNKRMRDLRIDHELTKEQLAKLIGVSSRTITRYERGEAEPNLNVLIQLAIVFGVTTDYICDLNDETKQYGNDVKDDIEQAITILSKVMKDL